MSINTQKYKKRARRHNVEAKARDFVDSWTKYVQEKGMPMQFKYKENEKSTKDTVITVYEAKGYSEPVITKNGTLSSREEVIASLAEYEQGTPGGLRNLKDELDEPMKMNGLLEEMRKLHETCGKRLAFRVDGKLVEFCPGDEPTPKEKILETFMKFRDRIGTNIGYYIKRYPENFYRDLKSEAKQAASQVK